MRNTSALFTLLIALHSSPVASSAQRTAHDQQPVVALRAPVISGDGAWVAAEERSDGNNGNVRVWSTDGAVTYTIARGQNPRICRNSRWVSALQRTPEQESSSDRPRNERTGQTLVLLDTKDGSRRTFDFVVSYDVTYTSSYLMYLQSPERESDTVDPSNENGVQSPPAKPTTGEHGIGTLHVVHLNGDKVQTVENVTQFIPHLTHANHEENDHYAYVVHDETTGRDTLYLALVNSGPENRGNFGMRGIHTGHKIEGLQWAQNSATAVFLDHQETTGKDGKPKVSSVLYTWHDVPGRPGQRGFTRVETPE